MERRNLAAAYKFYCGRKMEEDFQAHLANEDTEATYKVLMGQLDMYAPGKQEEEERQLPNDMDAINELCNQRKNVDFAGRIIWAPVKGPDGKPLPNPDGTERLREEFNFGKYKGMAVVDVLRRDPGYYSWMLSSDFTLDTKQVLTRIRLRESQMLK
jgi:DNA polymerase-3 subunit epsilon